MLVRGSLLLVAVFLLGMILPGMAPAPPSAAGSGGTALEAPASALLAPKPKPRRDRPGRPGEGRFKAAGEAARCTGPGVEVLPKSGRCTHGGDPVPPGLNRLPRDGSDFQAQAEIACEGDGHTGSRVQVFYAYAPGEDSDFPHFQANIQGWLTSLNNIYMDNAIATGGARNIRFVTDGACQPIVLTLPVSALALVDFDQMINEFQAQGYNRQDRIYLSFVDVADEVAGYCGIGTISFDDRHDGNVNYNNVGPAYSAVVRDCWQSRTPAHELMHNLGGVQRYAPFASGFGHCIDDHDIMCYRDDLSVELIDPPPCPDPNGEQLLLDCGHDSYYNANPAPNSHLSNFWNPTNNRFLGWGVPDNAPPGVNVSPPPSKRLIPGKRVKITAGTADDTGISSVAFSVCRGAACAWGQGKQIGIDGSAPYQANWKVPAKGTYTFVARAIDAVGNVTVSAPKRVKIKPAKKKKKAKGKRSQAEKTKAKQARQEAKLAKRKR